VGLDLYYLGIHREDGEYASGSGDEHRHTLGAREFAARNHWDWEAEQMLQVGSFGNDSILSWAAAINAGYTWDTTWNPRLGLKAGATSGDDNPNDGHLGTFDALFFKSGYFNDASLIRPQNIISVHPNLTVHPLPKVTVDGGASPFWRYSQNDAIYAVPGFVSIPALHNASSYVGTAFDVNLNWQIQRHISFQASYVHFLTGSYVPAYAGADGPIFSRGAMLTAALAKATGARPVVVGKPSRAAVREVETRLGVRSEATAVIGDDAALDVPLGHLGGSLTVLVRSGISGELDVARIPERRRPHVTLDTVADLLDRL